MKDCDECGKETENLSTIEIDPIIKIEGFDYPHTFEVCDSCLNSFLDGEEDRECKSYEVNTND